MRTNAMKRLLCGAAALVCLSSCGSRIGKVSKIPDSVPVSGTTHTTAPEKEPDEDQPEITSVEEKKVEPEAVAYKEYSKTIQAESGELSGNAEKADEREGFDGKGYVTGLDEESSCAVTFDLPESQYYNITVTAAADKKAKGVLSAADRSVGEFTVPAEDGFSLMTFYNVYLEKGEAEILITSVSKTFDADSITVEASTEIRDLSIKAPEGKLINKNASAEARALYKYICGSYGTQIITGQHDTCGTLTETRRVYELTGRAPAIRGGDLMPFTQDMIIGENEIEYAKEWAEDGGLISYMWNWTEPVGEGGSMSCYADNTDFDIKAAVTEEDIALLSPEEIDKLLEDGKISEECAAIVRDIDKVSEKLEELNKANIPVLWRPLHEASNGYYWWGKNKAAYKWLWQLLYTRQTEYHKLDNLIWVWSAQSADWYVGDELCDIVSCDIYDSGNTSGQVDQLIKLMRITENKPAVISECGNLPSVSRAAGEKAVWGYIMQWGGSYLLNEDGSLNEENTPLDALIEFYNNDLTVTRDELPDLGSIAEELRQKDKEAAEKSAEEEKKEKDSSKDEKDKEKEKEKE